jgi:hypothetical protein
MPNDPYHEYFHGEFFTELAKQSALDRAEMSWYFHHDACDGFFPGRPHPRHRILFRDEARAWYKQMHERRQA